MAGVGPPPKDDEKRQRTNAGPESVELDRDARVDDAPELPGADGYLPATVSWYQEWCESAQAAQFLNTDWQRLHMIAPLVDSYFRNPVPRVMAEIRLNEAKLGATADDRLRLRWRLRRADQEAESAERQGAAAGGERRSSREGPDPRLSVLEGGRKAS